MTDNDNNTTVIDFSNALSERYLSYALSTIMSRSLPDVRDGLKPVHRRILYAMLQLKLNPDSAYKKCARIVGDVIGKYHPHGDGAVYDTLVRLAQNFALRYPLIDGQGNFGSVDGDNAAAMRYTESRMTEICTLLMTDIDKNTVDFRNTYDESELEPVLMPAVFPNLLSNGSEGIAVGMATSIPPHNLHELCDAMLYMIDNPAATVQDVLKFIQGPDFPTGGVIVDNISTIHKSYETGRGSFRLRARWNQEPTKNKLCRIIITEIPYQIQKSRILEQIADLLKDKKLPHIVNVRDESAEEIRIVIEINDCCPAQNIVEALFKLTDLETRIQLNMNVIASDNIPKVMNLLEVLQEFLAHRQNIILRRSRFQISVIENRMEILNGLKVAYINLDEIITIIREEEDPKKAIFLRFGLSDKQIDAILNIRLRSLRKLDEYEIIREYDELQKQHDGLLKILSTPKELWKIVKTEIRAIQAKFGIHTNLGKRRSCFMEAKAAQVIDMQDFNEKIPITILCSRMGWIRALKGHNHDLTTIKYKEGDSERFVLQLYSTDRIVIASSSGKFFTIQVQNIYQGKGHGESIRLMIDINNDDIIAMFVHTIDAQLLLASTNGKGFIVSAIDVLASTKNGKQIMIIPEGEKCIACHMVCGDSVAVTGQNRKLLVFDVNEIPVMKRGVGVILQKFKDAKLTDIVTFKSSEGLALRRNSKIFVETNTINWRGKRGSSGKLVPTGFPKDHKPFIHT